MNIGQEDNQVPDLGFDIGQDDNLFELFAKGQTSSTPTAVDLTPADTTDPNKPNPPSDKTDVTVTTTEDEPAKETPVDGEAIQKLIAAGIKGEDASEKPDAAKPEGDATDPGNETEVSAVSIVYEDFKEKGILQVPEDFEFDGTAEGLQAAIEVTLENRLGEAVDQTIEEAFQKHPENAQVAKDLIKHLGQGGKISDFVSSNTDRGIDVKQLDADDEAVRSKTANTILTNYYREVLKWPDDKIKRQLERAAAKGEDLKIEEARDVYEEYKAHKDKQREDLKTSVASADAKRKQQILEFNTNLSKAIDTADEVAGFKLKTKQEREALKDYLFKPTEDLNGKKVPKFLADRHRLLNDPTFTMAQALWMKNGMKPDTKDVVTKVTNSLEEKLSNLQKGKKASAASGQGIENKNRSTPGLLDFDNLEVITV